MKKYVEAFNQEEESFLAEILEEKVELEKQEGVLK